MLLPQFRMAGVHHMCVKAQLVLFRVFLVAVPLIKLHNIFKKVPLGQGENKQWTNSFPLKGN